MIRYELTDPTGGTVVVALDVARRSERGCIAYEGREIDIEPIRWDVRGSPGFRGRPLGERATAAELDFAMRTSWLLRRYRPRLVMGRAVLDRG